MDQRHRDILKKKRVDLVDNIANPLEVVDALFSGGILTDDLKEQIQAQQTNRDKVRKILDIVPARGIRAFSVFNDALLKTQNEDAAQLLNSDQSDSDLADTRIRGVEPAGAQATKQTEKLPEEWPLEQDLRQPVAVQSCLKSSYIVKQYWKSNEAYSMRKRKRGRCVIISNKTFKDPNLERKGTDNDVKKLSDLFEQLHFDVVVHRDKKAEEMKTLLQTEAKHTSHRMAECFVLILCSHGTEFGIYGTDELTVEHKEILTNFNSQNCRSLASKPKLVFLQSCHGDERDVGGEAADGKASASKASSKSGTTKQSGIEDAFKQLSIQSKGGVVADSIYVETDGKKCETIPTNSDFLVARATHPGFVAFRHEEMGSWFLQAVVWVFQRYAHDKDIHQLLTLVNNLVSKGRVKIPGRPHEVMQAARIDYSLRKTFYFFPGMVE